MGKSGNFWGMDKTFFFILRTSQHMANYPDYDMLIMLIMIDQNVVYKLLANKLLLWRVFLLYLDIELNMSVKY